MAKSAERQLRILTIVGCLFVIGGLSLLGFVHFKGTENYLWNVEGNATEFLSKLEKILGINFPDNIKEIKIAKSKPFQGNIDFVIKLTTDVNNVNEFVNSLDQESLMGIFREYSPEIDTRKWECSSPTPAWFRKPISQGKKGEFLLSGILLRIYTDTSDENNSVVYISGTYPEEATKTVTK